jgi:hypothetical protein
VAAGVVGQRGDAARHRHAGEVEVALLGGAGAVEDEHARLDALLGEEQGVREPVVLAGLWNGVGHNHARLCPAA